MLYQGETIEYALFTAIYILLTIQSLVPNRLSNFDLDNITASSISVKVFYCREEGTFIAKSWLSKKCMCGACVCVLLTNGGGFLRAPL